MRSQFQVAPVLLQIGYNIVGQQQPTGHERKPAWSVKGWGRSRRERIRGGSALEPDGAAAGGVKRSRERVGVAKIAQSQRAGPIGNGAAGIIEGGYVYGP